MLQVKYTWILLSSIALTITMTVGQEQPKQETIDYEALRQEGRRVWEELEKKWGWEKIRANLEIFSHRPLSPDEQAYIQKALAFAKNPKNDRNERKNIVLTLGIMGHASMIEGLKEIAWQAPPSHKDPQSGVSVWAVISLSFIANKHVIDILIELVEHPNRLVRLEALTRLYRLVGREMPEKYQRSKGFNILILDDEDQRRKMVTDLKVWWQNGKEKIKVKWETWEEFNFR
ncbi:MAG: HEAT repeat domain-containing protein [Aquificaceae bacterium]|nr:HEAT repeat domain-containing protein [Aquificaceae bacterium]